MTVQASIERRVTGSCGGSPLIQASLLKGTGIRFFRRFYTCPQFQKARAKRS